SAFVHLYFSLISIIDQLLPAIFLVLLFSSYSPHRALHSFPTRRSSDLYSVRPGPVVDVYRVLRAPARERRGVDDGQPRRRRAVRSEEHTSELQSHLNLVCRLLLEKKKKKNKTDTKISTHSS